MTYNVEIIVKHCLTTSLDESLDPSVVAKLESARMTAIAAYEKRINPRCWTDILVKSPFVSGVTAVFLIAGLGSVQASQKDAYDSFFKSYSMVESNCPEDIAAYSDTGMFALVGDSGEVSDK